MQDRRAAGPLQQQIRHPSVASGFTLSMVASRDIRRKGGCPPGQAAEGLVGSQCTACRRPMIDEMLEIDSATMAGRASG